MSPVRALESIMLSTGFIGHMVSDIRENKIILSKTRLMDCSHPRLVNALARVNHLPLVSRSPALTIRAESNPRLASRVNLRLQHDKSGMCSV
jgi:hypothetical protein